MEVCNSELSTGELDIRSIVIWQLPPFTSLDSLWHSHQDNDPSNLLWANNQAWWWCQVWAISAQHKIVVMFYLFRSSSLAWPRPFLKLYCSLQALLFNPVPFPLLSWVSGLHQVGAPWLLLYSSDISPNKSLAHLNWSWYPLFGGSKLTLMTMLYFWSITWKKLDWISSILSSSEISPIFEILEDYLCFMKEEKQG